MYLINVKTATGSRLDDANNSANQSLKKKVKYFKSIVLTTLLYPCVFLNVGLPVLNKEANVL